MVVTTRLAGLDIYDNGVLLEKKKKKKKKKRKKKKKNKRRRRGVGHELFRIGLRSALSEIRLADVLNCT